MKFILKYSFIFFVFLSLTSCFDIIDKISLKADGSGEYSVILNASKSKTRLQSISKMETINGKKVPKKSEIDKKLNDASAIFKTVSGISNVKTSFDAENYIIKLSCNFKKIENINAGLELLKSKNVIGKMIPTQLYKNNSSEKILVRNKISSFKTEYDKMSSADKEVFTNATYTSILQFENLIKSQTNSEYKISPNKKAIKLDGTILDFILQKKQVQNTITLQ
ncbi:hypothetical protein [Epilithonimonas arachidiradicis]|uniref:Lipoprotein n=1 Tax=Epilithonimonas arachidiradicis TaxID=1617282 RepID=A0A420DCM2_9FLAO|nr:hypothetical protein [Epilithonimonas arachidiradicis]RKE89536.1 hypothetical protein BXY58_0099 [Epilithonimonas arachidiradicis]